MTLITRKIWKWDGVTNAEILHRRLSYFMLRRTKTDVAMELPPKTRVVIDVEIPKKNRFTFSPALFKNKGAIRKALDVAADGKIKPAIEMILNDLEEESNEIVFTHRKLVAEHVVDCVAAAGYDCGFIHSGVSQAKRDTLIKNAQQAKGAFLIAATIDSTSTGIDLSHANVATVLEIPYQWHTLAQAESRLHRFGQERPVLIRYVVARATGDELILKKVLDKIEGFEQIVGALSDNMRADLDTGPKTDEEALDELYQTILKGEDESDRGSGLRTIDADSKSGTVRGTGKRKTKI